MANNITTTAELIRGLIKDPLKNDGRVVEEYTEDNKFLLNEDFVTASSIIVYQNGSEMNTADWSYDSDTNEIVIVPVTSGVSLTEGDTIVITFDYHRKYSDTELMLYIKSSLIWFAVFRHDKLFEINNNETDIISVNDINPTQEELYLIAMITAIEIDPNNVTIRTPDFTISPVENQSKKEQIANIFSKWRRFVGTIEFLEDEDVV